ncbi:ubiquinone biosynthesis monooxygenase COQ6 [Elsinoe australis]|uniref:Ubiquinone biosynthesis monooxygenase COQ6 n=1 Tax=Elsinoe australis TaxID=40998 RepID=A0A2P7ZAG5_9PEZI|nr:ubiquinone biosynthesis monooxygenase COQ6 [Elsinoe australis]
MSPQKILIIGTGIAGPVLATFLLLSPLPASSLPHITLLERSSSPRPHGQNIDIRGTGMTIIRKLGLEGTIRASTTGEEGVQFVDEQNRILAQFEADKTGKVQTGTSDVEILRGKLAEILLARCMEVSQRVEREGGKGVECIFGDVVEELEQDGDGVKVKFRGSGEERRFDLVVGADGLQSRTRRMVFGQEGESTRLHRLGAYGGFFSMPRGENDGIWRRWFITYGRKGVMVRPHTDKDKATVFMMALTLKDGRFEEVAVKGNKGAKEQKELLEEYFRGAGWECDRIIKEMNASDDFYYDMIAQVKMDSWSKGRVVLLGDAGYCGSPLSGMGTTLGLNGAYNLAGALLQHPDDYTAAFAQYEERIRPLVDRAQKLAPGMPWLIHPGTTWGIFILRSVVAAMYWSNIQKLVASFAGPPANAVPVGDYGFKELPEAKL